MLLLLIASIQTAAVYLYLSNIGRASLLFMGDEEFGQYYLPNFRDADAYNTLASNLYSGKGFTDRHGVPSAFVPPLYPFAVGLAYKLAGFNWRTAFLLNLCLSAGSCFLIFRILERWGDSRAAGAGLVLFGLYPRNMDMLSGVVTEHLYFFLILLCLFLCLRTSREDDSTRNHVHLGLAMGLAALCRGVFLIYLPLIMAWLAWTVGKPLKTQLPKLATVALLGVLLPSFWVVRNWLVLGEFVYSTNASVLWTGNHHGLEESRFGDRYRVVIADSLSLANLRRLEIDTENDNHWEDHRVIAVALNWIKEHPRAYLALCFQRFKAFCLGIPSDTYVNGTRLSPSDRNKALSFFAWLVLVSLSGVGLYRSGMTHLTILCLGFVVITLLFHSLVFLDAGQRYKLPAEVVMALTAGMALRYRDG